MSDIDDVRAEIADLQRTMADAMERLRWLAARLEEQQGTRVVPPGGVVASVGDAPLTGSVPPGDPGAGPFPQAWPLPPGFAPPAWPGFAPPAWPAGPSSYPPRAPGTPTAPGPQPGGPQPGGPDGWAGSTGMRILGWAGGAVTIIGVVLLLALAVQYGWWGDVARVVTGLVLGLVILGAAAVLRPRPAWTAMAVMLTWIGLGIEFLVVVGAVRLLGLLPVVGLFLSALLVLAAVVVAQRWRQPWLAAAAFATGVLLTPVVLDGLDARTLLFVAVLVAGGGATYLAGVGWPAWLGAGGGALLLGVALSAEDRVGLAAGAVGALIGALAWATGLLRLTGGRMIPDPGPFPMRMPSSDPVQVARDWADFHAHERRRSQARIDRAVPTISLIAGAVLATAILAMVQVEERQRMAFTLLALSLALLLLGVAIVGRTVAELADTPTSAIAVLTAITLTAIASRGTSLAELPAAVILALAIVALVGAAATRAVWLLTVAAVAAVVAVPAAMTMARPAELFLWPTPLTVGNGISRHAGLVVWPTGIGLIVLAAAAVAAVHRCTVTRPGGDDASPWRWWTGAGPQPMSASARRHLQLWTVLAAAVVGCYGLIATAVVSAVAISPSWTGFQMGHVTATAVLLLAGGALLWGGFAHLDRRITGLMLFGVAVVKLLLVDTVSLSDLARALSFIGVGLVLLAGALLWVARLSPRSPTNGPPGTGGGDAIERAGNGGDTAGGGWAGWGSAELPIPATEHGASATATYPEREP